MCLRSNKPIPVKKIWRDKGVKFCSATLTVPLFFKVCGTYSLWLKSLAWKKDSGTMSSE